MKKSSLLLTVSMALTLTACGEAGKQWWDPDTTFASVGQPDVKGMNDTQEDMAKEAVNNGDFARAAKFYEMLVSSGKGTAEQRHRYKLGLASATRRIGDNERALGMFEALLQDSAADLDAAEGRALTLMATGKTVEASRAFSDIVEKDPKRWRTLNALGILFVTKGMVPEASSYYTEALKYSPDNPAILNNMGLSQAIDKNYKRSIDILDQASRVSKNASQRKQIDLNEALVYAVANDLDKAHDIAAKYYDGAALDNNMGLYAHLSKDDALAKTYLNMALSQSPTFYERAWSNLDALNDGDDDVKTRKFVDGKSEPKVDDLKSLPKETEKKTSKSFGKFSKTTDKRKSLDSKATENESVEEKVGIKVPEKKAPAPDSIVEKKADDAKAASEAKPASDAKANDLKATDAKLATDTKPAESKPSDKTN